MFSKTCEYAIRAMIFIAQKTGKSDNRVGVKEIAAGIDSSEFFIAKILQDLSKRGLIQSAKGPNGGFYIEKDARKISIADVVKAIDGDKIFTGCGLGLPHCSEDHPCPIHHEFKKVRRAISTMLESAKISDFNEKIESRLAFLKQV